MFLLAKYTQKRLFYILEANLIFEMQINALNAFKYSIWRIPLTELKMIAWSFLENV